LQKHLPEVVAHFESERALTGSSSIIPEVLFRPQPEASNHTLESSVSALGEQALPGPAECANFSFADFENDTFIRRVTVSLSLYDNHKTQQRISEINGEMKNGSYFWLATCVVEICPVVLIKLLVKGATGKMLITHITDRQTQLPQYRQLHRPCYHACLNR
jgi:hypothetical protein